MSSDNGDHLPERPGNYWQFVDKAIARITQRMPNVDPDAMRLVMSLNRAARLIAYDTQSALLASDLVSRAALRVLFVLYVEHPMEMRDVVNLTGMSRAATSAIVLRMESDGLVLRLPSERDGRSVVIELLPKGEECFEQGFAKFNQREILWKEKISSEHAENLVAALNQLMNVKYTT